MSVRCQQGMNFDQTVKWKQGTPAAKWYAGLLPATQYATGQNYAQGALVYVGAIGTSNNNIYRCATAITNSATQPTGTGASIADANGTWEHVSNTTLQNLIANEFSGNGYARQVISNGSGDSNVAISAAGVMSLTTQPKWGTGVSFSGAALVFVCDVLTGYASGHLSHVQCLSALRTLTTTDTLTETITDTAS